MGGRDGRNLPNKESLLPHSSHTFTQSDQVTHSTFQSPWDEYPATIYLDFFCAWWMLMGAFWAVEEHHADTDRISGALVLVSTLICSYSDKRTKFLLHFAALSCSMGINTPKEQECFRWELKSLFFCTNSKKFEIWTEPQYHPITGEEQ